MKKLLYILCAAALAAGCSDDDASSYYLDELVIDTANCLAEGSYVQGVEANDLCRIKIPYENAKGGTARISAPETNGLRIDAQEVTLVSGAGEATVAVKGTPLLLETSFLQLNVEYRAKTYLSSVEIAVLEDVDPSGTIEFEIDRTPLTGLPLPKPSLSPSARRWPRSSSRARRPTGCVSTWFRTRRPAKVPSRSLLPPISSAARWS